MTLRRLAAAALLLVVVVPVATVALAQAEATVRATVDAVKIGEGETVSFTVEVSGSEIPDVENPDLGPVRDFTVAAGPSTSTSTSMVWRGGGAEVTSSRKYSYALLPRRIGTLTIPALEVTVGGRVHRTRSIQVEVVKGAVRSGRGGGSPDPLGSLLGRRRRQPEPSEAEIFVTVELDRERAYVGQQVLLTHRIYTQASLAALPQPTELPSLTGFWVEEIPVDPRATLRKKVIRGKEYTEITLMKKALFPTRSGRLTIEETVYQVPVSVRSSDPFDRLLNPSRTIYRRVEARSLEVLPLPEEGRPDSFRGAVGRYIMNVEADRSEASVNDAVGITVEVSGDGNLQTLSDPVVGEAPDYRRFDPKVNESRSVVDDRLQGSKEWSYVFVPLTPGDQPIPPIRFAYFDPVSAAYRELQSPNFIIKVGRGRGTASAPGPGGVRREVVAMREDIRYIKAGSSLRNGASSFHLSGWFYLLLALPVAGNAALFAHLRWREHLEANVPLFRRRRATRVARQRLQRAGRLAASGGEVEAFFDEVDRALTGFIADKFDVAASGLTRDRIAGLLEDRKVSPELRQKALACLDHCDMGRFAPGGTGRDQLEGLVSRSREVLSVLERSLG